jgi:hypothetical protein
VVGVVTTMITVRGECVRPGFLAAMLGLAALCVLCPSEAPGFVHGPNHSSSPVERWSYSCSMEFPVPAAEALSLADHSPTPDFVAVVSTETVAPEGHSGSVAPLDRRAPETSSFSSLVQRSPPAVA